PSWSAWTYLQGLHRTARGGQNREGVRARVESVNRDCSTGPNTPAAGRFGKCPTQRACGGQLILGSVALENLSDLEQGQIRVTPVGIALRRHDQARNEARTHIGQLNSDWIGKRQLRLATIEQFGLLLRYE